MTVRNASPAALAFERTPAQARHLCRQAGFVNENKFVRIKIKLPLEPGLPGSADIITVLFAGVSGFF